MTHPLGTLFIISAASGTGKTSLSKAASEMLENVVISVSHTTRSIKNSEVPNKHYFFIDKPTFEQMIAQQQFLEYAVIYDNYYGTSELWVREQLERGMDVILDIDWQGAKQIKQKMPAVGIFLLPPSKVELQRRLETRQRDDADNIQIRLAAASDEIAHYQDFDYLVINDSFERALADIVAIIRSKRLTTTYQHKVYGQLIRDLLGEA